MSFVYVKYRKAGGCCYTVDAARWATTSPSDILTIYNKGKHGSATTYSTYRDRLTQIQWCDIPEDQQKKFIENGAAPTEGGGMFQIVKRSSHNFTRYYTVVGSLPASGIIECKDALSGEIGHLNVHRLKAVIWGEVPIFWARDMRALNPVIRAATQERELPVFRAEEYDVTIVKYKHGAAYYIVDSREWKTESRLDIQHALSPLDSFAVHKCKLQRVEWDSIPEQYKEDMLKYNQTIAKQYGDNMSTGRGMFANLTRNTNQPAGENNMNNPFNLGDFGPITSGDIKLSPKGIAIQKNAPDGSTKYVVWEPKQKVIIDVTMMVMDMPGMLFLMPTKELVVGDIIKQDGEFVYVQEIDDGQIVVLAGSGRMIPQIKTISMFGFDFYSKVVTPLKSIGDSGSIAQMMKMQMMMGMFGGGGGSGQQSGMGGGMGGMMQMQMMMGMMGGDKGGMGDFFDFDGMFDFDPKEESKDEEGDTAPKA